MLLEEREATSFTIEANIDVTTGDLKLQFWFFDKPNTNMYLMRCETHQTTAYRLETLYRTAVHSSVLRGDII